jgi:excisionase family DNA binding protein
MNNQDLGREPQTPLLLSIKQAAQALSLSERTVWTLVQTRELPHVRVGRRLLFSRMALESWIDRQQSGGNPKASVIG